jgi:hypothetical protein
MCCITSYVFIQYGTCNTYTSNYILQIMLFLMVYFNNTKISIFSAIYNTIVHTKFPCEWFG